MKTFLDFIDEAEGEWITTKGGHHVLIDPDSGEIKSGSLKGTNIKNLKQNANPKRQKALKNAFSHSSCTDAALNKTFAPDSPMGKEIDKMKIVGFEPRGNRAKYAEKAFKALSDGLEGSKLDKFKKEYEDACSVFKNKEAMDIAHEMETMAMYKKDIDQDIETMQKKVDELRDTSKSKKEMANRKPTIEKLEKDIKSLQDKKAKYDKWKDKVKEAKTTFLKMSYRYNRYLKDFPEGEDE